MDPDEAFRRALLEAEEIGLEELEAAAEMWDRLVRGNDPVVH